MLSLIYIKEPVDSKYLKEENLCLYDFSNKCEWHTIEPLSDHKIKHKILFKYFTDGTLLETIGSSSLACRQDVIFNHLATN